jgi:hypothetical protein
MPKRELADRILDEILTLRRPQQVMLELDAQVHPESKDDGQVLEEEIVAASPRRRLIVE